MGAPQTEQLSPRDQAVRDLLLFVRDFSLLMDKQMVEAREIMSKTVDQVMASVNAINDAADDRLKKADELLVKDSETKGFVSRSAKEVDVRFADPAARVKAINEHISNHMSTLNNLDENVRAVLFSIMGALSMDDVVRQRLEHVTTSVHAMGEGVSQVVENFSHRTFNDGVARAISAKLADKMYKSFTMEDEKSVFRAVLGDIKNFRKS